MGRMPNAPVVLDLSHIDYSALDAPVTRDEVRAFRRATRSAQRANPSIATGLATATSVASIIALVVFVIVFAIVLFGVVGSIALSGAPSAGSLAFGLFFLVVFGIVALVVVRSLFGSGGQWRKWMRLSRFAGANGLQFRSASRNPSYPGCVFNLGDGRRAYDHLTTARGRYLDFGNYEYTTGSGKNRTTHHWGFLAMNLDRNLPNIVLDSKANNGLFGGTNLPASFNRDQVLSLEGDFDTYFTLYCPKEYERDALYIFTPDLMALLIDDASPFDVEIVDNWLFLYSATPFSPLSRTNYERLFRIVQTVGAKTLTQTERYHDDRVGSTDANIVAPAGQRLRHGVSISSLIVFGVIAAFWAFNLLQGVLGR
jgi:hypothetical protein